MAEEATVKSLNTSNSFVIVRFWLNLSPQEEPTTPWVVINLNPTLEFLPATK